MTTPRVQERNFDQIMWSGEIISDWGQSDTESFFVSAGSYRHLALESILENPDKAIAIVYRDIRQLLSPFNSPRFTGAQYSQEVWIGINPRIVVPTFEESSNEDLLYISTIWQSYIRNLSILGLFLFGTYTIFRQKKLSSNLTFLLSSWFIYLILLSTFSYPSPRYMVYSDVFIFLIPSIFTLPTNNIQIANIDHFN